MKHKQQPGVYSELPAGRKIPGLMFPMGLRCCMSCAHHERFGTAALVVWCTKHGGHLPGGATCDSYRLAPPNS